MESSDDILIEYYTGTGGGTSILNLILKDYNRKKMEVKWQFTMQTAMGNIWENDNYNLVLKKQ